MENLLQKLIDVIFHCDRQGVAGILTIVTDLNKVSFHLEDGYLTNSSLKGPGQTFFDFLLSTGRLTRQGYGEILHLSKKEDIAPWVALMRTGRMTEEDVATARYQLSAQRFSLFMVTKFVEVRFDEVEHSGAEGHFGAQKAVFLLLEHLRIAHESGNIKPFKIPPYAIVRPTDRLKAYIDSFRSIIPGQLPLPLVGGETYESLELKYGHASADVLSILLLTGMLKTEIEEIATAGQTDVQIERLYFLIKRMVILNSRGLIDDSGADFELALETGNLLLEGFSAFDISLQYYKRISQVLRDEDIATERKLLLGFLAGSPVETKMEMMPLKISSLPAGRDTKATLLRHLAIYYFFRGKVREAARCIHEAFIYKPYDFENLALFVQFFIRDPSIALKSRRKRELEIESFKEGEYPEVLPLVISCARENEQFELISWIMKETIGKVQMSSQVFDLVIEIMRERRWGPDLVEFIAHFSLSSDRKGWTNPLWTLGALYSSERIEETLNFAREAYEILIKTSSGKLWAFTKLVDIMDKISQPNMMLELLEKSFGEVTDPQQKAAVGEKLASLLMEEFGELKEAGCVASRVVEIDPENEIAINIILQALSDRKLGLSSCYRFVKSMLHSSAAASGHRIRWLRQAALAAEEFLGAPDFAAALLARIIEENPELEDLADVRRERRQLESDIESIRSTLVKFKDTDGGFEKKLVEKMREDPQKAAGLIRLMLQIPDERNRALGRIVSLFEGGEHRWETAGRGLVLADDRGEAERFIKSIVRFLPENIEKNQGAISFVEELSYFLKEADPGEDEDIGKIKERIYSILLRVQPFNRDVIAYYSDLAASGGDIESLFQFEERKIATSRTHERGKLYFELATYADLDAQFRMRGQTFWQIAGSSLAEYPPIVFNNLQELIRGREFGNAALFLSDSMEFMPRYLYPDLYAMASRLYLMAGQLGGYTETVDVMMEKVGWNEELLTAMAMEAMDGIGDEQHAVAIFGRMLQWHFLNSKILSFARFIFKLADNNEKLRSDVVSFFSACIDMPFPMVAESSGDLGEISEFFDDMGGYIHRWGHCAEAVRCMERSILLTRDRGEKLKRLYRLADIYQDMGPGGVEGLLLVVYRIRKENEEETAVESYLKYLASSLGINLYDEGGLASILMRSVREDELKWVDLVMAGFALWFTGNAEGAADFAQRSYEKHPEIIEGGFFAAYCFEILEKWHEAIDLYRMLSERSPSSDESSKLLKRASLIMDIKLNREKDSLMLLTEALSHKPEDDNLFHEIETQAVKLKDRETFIKVHEIVESHLPGRQTQRAFYYKYAKDMEDVFGDLETASRILLQALSLAPRRGPVVDSIVRGSIKMQKFKPIAQAVAVLKSAGNPRNELSGFALDCLRRFIAHDNLPSAYGLMSDVIELDPGLDIVEGVKQLSALGPSGVVLARKLLDRWITNLEAAIEMQIEDHDYYKRLDALSDMRDILIETSEVETGEEKFYTPSVLPPSIDEEWQQIAGHPDEEITLEMFPKVDMSERELMKVGDFTPPAPVEDSLEKEGPELDDDLPKVIIDLPPDEIEAISRLERLSEIPDDEEGEVEEAQEPARPEKEISAESSTPSIPPAKASKIIESIGKSESVEAEVIIGKPKAPAKAAKAGPVVMEKVIIDLPDEPAGEEEMTAKFKPGRPGEEEERITSSSVEVSIVSSTDETGRMEEDMEAETAWDRAMAAEEDAGVGPARRAGRAEEDAGVGPARRAGRAEEDAGVGPARRAGRAEEDAGVGPARRAGRAEEDAGVGPARRAGRAEEDAGVGPARRAGRAEEDAGVGPARRAGRAEPAPEEEKPGFEGDEAIREFIENPWELDRIKSMLDMDMGLFTNKSSQFLLRGIYSIFNFNASKFSIKDYKLIGRSGTSKIFTTIVSGRQVGPWLEILDLLWEYAPSLAIERLSDYGVNTADQITPFSSGPVAPVIERSIRAFGYVRASVYSKRERKMQIDVVRTNPPSVIVLLPLGRIPVSFNFYIGKNLWAASGKRILGYTLPLDEGGQIMEACVEAFGRPSKKGKIDPIVSSIVQDLWQIIPSRIQDRLRGMVQGISPVEFEESKKLITAECVKAGFLFSGDLMSAVREFLPGDMLSSIEGDIPKDLLEGIIRESDEIRNFMEFAFSRQVRDFMDGFVV